jgi:PKD repeat protein
MTKSVYPVFLFIALMNNAFSQTPAGYEKDSMPDCNIVTTGGDTLPGDAWCSFDIQTLESYPPQYRFVPCSSDSISWFYWDFGDGQGEYEISPVHQYAYGGYYTVCLTAKTFYGCKSYFCKTFYVEGKAKECRAYWVAFPADQTPISSVRPPDSIPYPFSNTWMFYDRSLGTPVSWHWSFGDGAESYDPYPFHTYAEAGTYIVCLEILTMDSCTSQYCDSIDVGIQQPCSLFGTVLDYGGLDACGLVIQLDYGPILEPVEIVPNFILKAGQRVMLSYTELNGYASACMTGKIVRIDCIQEVSECHAYFWHYDLDWVSSLPPIYQFVSDTSQTIIHWQWDLGDGTLSFEKSPQHRYEFSGYYTICLTTTNADKCSDTYCETSYFEGRYPVPGLCDYRLSIQTEMVVSSLFNCDGSASVKLIDIFGNAADPKSIWWSTGSEEKQVEGLCTNTEYQVTVIDPDGCYLTGSFIFNGGGSIPCDTLWGNWKYEKDGFDFAFSIPVYDAGYNCVWEFGDGTASQGSNVNHTYTEEGEYTVILKVYDTQGQVAYTREITVNTDDATGFSDQTNNIVGEVFPVPAKEILYVDIKSDATHKETIAIYNATGQQVLAKEIILPAGSVTLSLDIARLPAGIYSGLITSGSGNNRIFRFIK